MTLGNEVKVFKIYKKAILQELSKCVKRMWSFHYFKQISR